MFQFPGLPPPGLCVHPGVARLTTLRGSPIRRSSAPSPRAAPRGISLLRHVLLRHERPRHPPDALCHGRTPLANHGVAPVALGPCAALQSPTTLFIPRARHLIRRARSRFALVLAPLLLTCIHSVSRCGWEPYHPQKTLSIVFVGIVKRLMLARAHRGFYNAR